jgi:hypothetical protein
MNVAKKEGFELQKTCKFFKESQGAKNACGEVVYEEVNSKFTVI